MADLHAPEFKRMMRKKYGYDVRCDPDGEHATGIFAGRSDCTCINGGKGVFVEIKAGETRWTTRYSDPKKGWTVQQREYGEWAETINETEYYVCLFIGNQPPNYDPSKYPLIRRAYLIPYVNVLYTVKEAESYCNFIPYRLGKGSRKDLVKAKLSCIDRFSEWELNWSQGGWEIPNDHRFYKRYIG